MTPYRSPGAEPPPTMPNPDSLPRLPLWYKDATDGEVALFDAACIAYLELGKSVGGVDGNKGTQHLHRADNAVEQADRLVARRRQLLGRR